MSCRRCPRFARRRFIASGSAGIVTVGMSSGCQEHIVSTLGEDVEVALADYPELDNLDETALVEFEGVDYPVAITRVGEDDAFVVTGTECNHQGCEVDRSGDGWTCSCHGARFALDGALRDGPATDNLTQYDYEVDEAGVMTIFAPA